MNLVFLRHPLLSQFLDPTLWSLILTIGPDPWSGFSMAIIWVYFPVCVHWLNEDHSSYHEIGKIMGNVVRIEWGYSPEPVSAAAVKTSFSCSQLSNNGCSCVCDVVRFSNWLDSGLGNLTMCDVAFPFAIADIVMDTNTETNTDTITATNADLNANTMLWWGFYGKREADAYTIGQLAHGLPVANAYATGHPHNAGVITRVGYSGYGHG